METLLNFKRNFILEYWIENNWYVGKLKGIPGVFSQGETLIELIENIKEVYNLMIEDEEVTSIFEKKYLEIEV
jgi:predicted RNase H-like HicB family nuclease